MNTEENETMPVIQQFHATRSSEFNSIYANNVNVVSNFFDCSMVFGEMTGIKDNIVMVDEKVRVVMTLSQVKLLAMSLISQLDQYEQRFGAVPLPAEIVPPELKGTLRSMFAGARNEG